MDREDVFEEGMLQVHCQLKGLQQVSLLSCFYLSCLLFSYLFPHPLIQYKNKLAKSYKRLQSQGHVKNYLPMFVACLVVEIIRY